MRLLIDSETKEIKLIGQPIDEIKEFDEIRQVLLDAAESMNIKWRPLDEVVSILVDETI